MFSLVSEREERAIGAEHHPEILNEYGLYEELPRINAYVAMVSARILAASDISSQVLTVTVLDTDVVNAFALPGGYIYVTRGLLALANDEAELAGVIGHEIGHVAARHTAQRLTWARVAEIAVTVVDASMSHLEYGGLATDVSGLAAHAVIAGYSREQEIESDTLGVRYLARAGYDPYAMATFLRQLERHSELQDALSPLDHDPSFLTRWFATHPRTADRVVLAAREARSEADTRILNRDSCLRMIDGIAYGGRADQGCILERRFVHPAWRFAFDVPEGLAMFRVNGQVRAYDDAGALVAFDGVEEIHRGATPHLFRWADELRVRIDNPRPSRLRDSRRPEDVSALPQMAPTGFTGWWRLLSIRAGWPGSCSPCRRARPAALTIWQSRRWRVSGGCRRMRPMRPARCASGSSRSFRVTPSIH